MRKFITIIAALVVGGGAFGATFTDLNSPQYEGKTADKKRNSAIDANFALIEAGTVTATQNADTLLVGNDASQQVAMATAGAVVFTQDGTNITSSITVKLASPDPIGSVAAGTVAATTLTGTDKLDVQSTITAGASNGHIIKNTYTGTSSGTQAGLIVKAYDTDTNTVHSGGEYAGLYVNVKSLSDPTAGGESALASLHNYGSGGSYEIIDYGVVLYGNLREGVKLTGGSSEYAFSCVDQTITIAEIEGSNGETIGNLVDGFWTIGGGLALTNSNSITMDGAACVTSNQTFLSATGVTNTLVIVDGLITAIN